jgi:hypothetical protein
MRRVFKWIALAGLIAAGAVLVYELLWLVGMAVTSAY